MSLQRKVRNLAAATTAAVAAFSLFIAGAPAASASSRQPWLSSPAAPIIQTFAFSGDGILNSSTSPGFPFTQGSRTSEQDFGGGTPKPACQTRNTGWGQTATTCTGNGDWVPDGDAMVVVWHNGYYVQAELTGTLAVHTKDSYVNDWACGGGTTHVEFTYADGSTSSKSPPCLKGDTYEAHEFVDLLSDASRDVVRIDFDSAPTGARTFFVGDDHSTTRRTPPTVSRLFGSTFSGSASGPQTISDGIIQWGLGGVESQPWRYGTLSLRPIIAAVRGRYTSYQYPSCGSTTNQRTRLKLQWIDLDEDKVDYTWTSPALAPGATYAFDAANPAKTPDMTSSGGSAPRVAVPFEVRVTVEVSANSLLWGTCGGQASYSFGNA